MSTPHIDAPEGAFADTVLLPGDPLRAAWLAEKFLDNVKPVNRLRNMLGFTGSYQGVPVSVMGSGMGIPSCAIYATELVQKYAVRRLLRIGTCGATQAGVALGDLVIAVGASTDSSVNRHRFLGCDYAAAASWPMLSALVAAAQAAKLPAHVGGIFSTDTFYGGVPGMLQAMQRMGILGVEMESAALFAIAAEHGVQAAALLTVSDNLLDHTKMPAQDRERGLENMAKVALAAVCAG